MADNLNHSNVQAVYKVVTKSMHNENDKSSTYYSEEKFQYDYSSILECKPSQS